MEKKLYYIINAAMLAAAGVWLVINRNLLNYLLNYKSWVSPEAVCIFLGMSAAGMIRLYIIFLEQKMNLRRYFRMYFRTEVINSILPVPFGEVFRIYNFSYEVSGYKSGICGILIERYFDLVAFAVTIGIAACITGRKLLTMFLLFGIAVLIFMVYMGFDSLYRYLNRFILLHVYSKYAPKALKALDEIKEWHMYIKNLLKGRNTLIILMTVIIQIFRLWYTDMILGDMTNNYLFSHDKEIYMLFLHTWQTHQLLIAGSLVLAAYVYNALDKGMCSKKQRRDGGKR